MKRFISLLFIALFAINLSAEIFEVNGINYNTTSANTVEVARKWDIYYSGNITIPSTVTYNNTTYSVTSIGNDAFHECYNLTSITIPNSVTSIGNSAFWSCESLTSVTIPSSVTSIGEMTFKYCTGLTSISIPNSVTSIGDRAFYCCESLTSITIPNSMTSIGFEVFFECYNLTSITIPYSVTSIGNGAFYACSSLTSITIPNSITSIGSYAFSTCSSLTSITIPNSVTSIKNQTFWSCTSLTSVTIPSSVTSIGEYAFFDCTGLTSITCNAIVPPSLGWDVFKNVPKSIPLYVPAGSINAYKAADQWKDFNKMWIVGIEPQLSIVNSSLSVYPNPTADNLHIDIKGNKSNTNFELINIQGQTISKGNFVGNTTLQTKELDAGVYFIKFINEAQSVEMIKFIKQ